MTWSDGEWEIPVEQLLTLCRRMEVMGKKGMGKKRKGKGREGKGCVRSKNWRVDNNYIWRYL